MTINNFIALFGGLALFLYGMHMMSNGLESAAGDKMKTILHKLTSNPILGILVGTLITALIQSSSATTVMVVGFVNSQLMTLNQAVWVIMGANIGTTITGQLIALDVSKYAPVIAFLGVFAITFIKKKRIISIGEILAGLGFLFIGMEMMKEAMVPLQSEPAFINAMSTISNPFVAILLGTGFTALIQSSSASVGILQTVAASGAIPLSSSIYIIFGQNIGTCVTSVLASLGANRNAKRTTIIHLSFNIIGTLLFIILVQFIPFVDWMEALSANPVAQIANTHTVFNIFTTLCLFPFGNKIAKLSQVILPIKSEEREDAGYDVPLTFIDTDNISSVPIAISSLLKEAVSMLQLAEKNVVESLESLSGYPSDFEKVDKRENRINFINYEITNYMASVNLLHMNQTESNCCNSIYKSFTDIERIGDHAYNLMGYSQKDQFHIENYAIVKNEITTLKDLLIKSFSLLYSYNIDDSDDCYSKMERIEDRIDELTATYRENQIQRLYNNEVSANDTIAYSQILIDIERISDHLMNIIQECKRYNFTLSYEVFKSGLDVLTQAS